MGSTLESLKVPVTSTDDKKKRIQTVSGFNFFVAVCKKNLNGGLILIELQIIWVKLSIDKTIVKNWF